MKLLVLFRNHSSLPLLSSLVIAAALAVVAALPSAAASGISFQKPVNYEVTPPHQITSADMDGDGNPDVMAYSGGTAVILYGHGNGTFEPMVAVSVSSDAPAGWASVHGIDVTGDGLPELVAAGGGDNRLVVRKNQGNRTFAAPAYYAAGELTVDVTAGDFNEDGHTDLAASNHNGRSMSVFLNQGDGTFQAQVGYPSNGYPGQITGGDYNRDGHADVAITNYISDAVRVYLGDGKGKFTLAGDHQAGSYPASIVTGDFNGDGNPDLATPNAFGGSVSVFYGDGKGGFSEGVVFPTPTSPHLMRPADLDVDGDLDLAIPTYGESLLTVLENDGTGAFLPPITFPSGGPNTRALASGDFNRDGRPDVAISNENGPNISIFLNNTPVATPLAPNNLAATAVSSTQINLSWTDTSANELGFQIERKTDTTGYVRIATTAPNVTRFQNSGLTPETRYQFRVRAYNPASGVSGYSNVAQATTLPGVPAAPAGLQVTVLSPQSLRLNWTDRSNNESSFEVERREPTTAFARVRNVGSNTVTVTDTGLQPGTVYLYRLRAVGPGGASPYTSAVRGETPLIPPSAPSGLTAAKGPGQVQLSWRDTSTNETGFQLERRQGSGAYARISAPGPNVTAVIDRAATPGLPYTYRVRAVNRGGESAWSNEVTLTLLPTLRALAVRPTAVRGGKKATGTVTLSHPAPAGGAVVTLASSAGLVRLPASVTVPVGAATATFRITTKKTGKTKTVRLTATYNASTALTSLKVKK